MTEPDYVALGPLELVYGRILEESGVGDSDGSSEDHKGRADRRGRACVISTGNVDSLGN